jgi:carbonic anhydrase
MCPRLHGEELDRFVDYVCMMSGHLSRMGRLALATAGMSLLLGAAPSSSARVTAADALGRLRAGNDRFVKDASATVSLGAATRQSLATGQAPFATILSCADSRVPPEFIFNAGLGDLFVVRAAGGVVDRSVMASLEYGAEHLHTPLLVVMGHESCDAVKTAINRTAVAGPNLQFLVSAIRAGITRTASDRSELRAAILANVEQVINDALGGSPILRRSVQAGSFQVVGAYYEMSSGRVMFSEPAAASPTAVHE